MRDAEKDLKMCEAATQGPWVVDGENAVIWDGNGQIVVVLDANGEPDNDVFVAESRTALPYWIKRAVAAEEREKKLVAALQLIAEESEDIISVDCAWDALRAYDEVKAEPIREWIRQQTDLSPAERDEESAD